MAGRYLFEMSQIFQMQYPFSPMLESLRVLLSGLLELFMKRKVPLFLCDDDESVVDSISL